MKRKLDRGVHVGDGQYASPASFLLMSGFLVYQAQSVDPNVRNLSRDIIDVVLTAARADGFTKGDILETMMSRGDMSERVWALAEEATGAIGDTNAFLALLQRAGIRREGSR